MRRWFTNEISLLPVLIYTYIERKTELWQIDAEGLDKRQENGTDQDAPLCCSVLTTYGTSTVVAMYMSYTDTQLYHKSLVIRKEKN